MQRTSTSRHTRLSLLASLCLLLAMLLTTAPANAQSDPNAPAALPTPQHLSPANESVTTALTDPPVGVPTLRWSAVPGATRYHVQISDSLGFDDTVVSENTVATSYTPRIVLADGPYYWRVRAEGQEGTSLYSDPWVFRKSWSADGQIRPVLLSPADDPSGQQVITSFGPEHFSWEPVPGAAAYIFEISASPDFNDAKPYRITTLKTHHTPRTQLANNKYYWRVIPIDTRDNAGEPSEVRSFTFGWNQVPTLIAPEHEIDTRFIPRFSWTAVPGAAAYVLEISSDENFSTLLTEITTRNTSYTLERALPNNEDYFWRVRAVSPQKVTGPPSSYRRFHANWVQPPVLLSPPARSLQHIYPYFSWTPVAGAERYQIQIATGHGFDNLIVDTTLINATSYTQAEWPEIHFGGDYIWRVRALDAQGNTTDWSSVPTFHFVASPPPNLIYPEPYYVPDVEGTPIHTDRTIAHPIFVWDTTHGYLGASGPKGFVYPDFYRLEVATSREFESHTVFTIDSAGQAAAPTLTHPFTVSDGSIYYWRVTPYRGDVQMAEGTVWETRIDRTIPQLPLDSDTVPDISHPQAGFISVGTAPILGWLPVAGAHHYEVQVSNARDFSEPNIVDEAGALFPYYVPWQGRRTPMPPDVYWWRVRAMDDAGMPLGDWTPERHFFVMDDLMTGNDYDYQLPNPNDDQDIGDTLLSPGDPSKYDPILSRVATDTQQVSFPYNVGPLHVVQDRSISAMNRQWVIAFGVDDVSEEQSLTYALYFDVNQKENVGGPTDPRNKPIGFDSLFLPEYVIYLDRTGNTVTAASFYEWTGSTWDGPFSLGGLGGSYGYYAESQAVQVIFPYSTIILENSDQFSGGIALSVYSTGSEQTAGPVDSVPQQGAIMDNPALFSNMPVPLYPFDTPPLSNPIVFHELPTLRWRMPHFNSTDGYIVQVARNPNFTQDTIVETWESFEKQTNSYYGGIPTAFHPHRKAYNDDESYYWRIRYRHERYGGGGEYDVSPWSPPMRFKLTSHQPGNPTIIPGNPAAGQPAYTTPTFIWDRVEGAARYTIQVDNDFNMNSPIINKTIDANSFTSPDTLQDGTYYWRVAMRRSNDVAGQWTAIMSFTKTSLVPTPLTPINGVVINEQPTFIWSAAISNTDDLHSSAPRYRLQWDDNDKFTSPTTVETENTSYTPIKGQSMDGGTWYWRVAMIDGNGRLGPDSPPAEFYVEYLQPELLSPVQGSGADETITFEWSPLNGAAYYKLEIDDNEAFDSPIRVTTENTRYTHTSSFAPGDYYWRVQMVDKDNRPGPTIPGRFSQGLVTAPAPNGSAIFMPLVVSP